MKIQQAALLGALSAALFACEDKPATPAGAGESTAKADATTAAEEPAAAAESGQAPACDKVVDKIASFNPGSGEPERKLWNKMCDEMTPEQRTCVTGTSDMRGMNTCMGSKGDEKLE
jgi:hypothetical protein